MRSFTVLSETSETSGKDWQSIADLATACRSILEALAREGNAAEDVEGGQSFCPSESIFMFGSDVIEVCKAAPMRDTIRKYITHQTFS